VSGTHRANVWLFIAAALVAGVVSAPVAQAQVAMPNPKEMSGNVLPVNDIPAGTVTVRVVRGAFKNIPGQPVDFLIAGRKRTVMTDANGRAEVSGLARGTQLTAEAVVDGEKLVSKPAVVESSGLRIILVATDREDVARAAEDKALAAAPAVKGIVVLGPESRVIAQMSDDRLHIYYVLDIINTARTPVDIGGPLVFDLPREARGATVLEGSSPQAVAAGARLRVTGPFAPGSTHVEAAYELPYSGGVAAVNQAFPAALDRVTILVPQIGGLTIKSPQLASLQPTSRSGQEVLVGTGPGLAAGQSLSFEIAGLPHRATWPRTLALTLASIIVAAGVWGAVTARPRYRVA
jgi:hypothetical protein